MNALTVYDVFHVNPFGWVVAAYFTMAAVAAGAFLLAAAVNLLALKGLQAAGRTAALMAPLGGALAGLLLIAELGRPMRFWRVFTHFNPASPVSWGAFILSAFIVIAVLYARAVLAGKEEGSRGLVTAGAVLACLIPVYTGFELIRGRVSPMWNSPLIPVLFLFAAGVAGLSAVVLIGSALTAGMARRLGAPQVAPAAGLDKAIALFLAGSLVLVVIQLLALAGTSAEATTVLRNILAGRFSVLFWGGYLAVGTIVPFAIFTRRGGANRALQALASLLAVLGVFALRLVDIIGGQSFPLN